MSKHVLEGPQRAHRIRFVTLCQQLLALAVVVAVLTPAARTVSMDVRPSHPLELAPTEVALQSAPTEVPTAPVEAEVDEYSLTPQDGAEGAGASPEVQASEKATADGGEVISSDVVEVEGYGTVGVTWDSENEVPDDAIEVQVRTKTGDTWSGWTDAEYHDEHGPDPRTAEGRDARPGTDALLVGHVDAVQVKVRTEDGAPSDMKLAVVDPGKASGTAKEAPAIDTARLSSATGDGAGGSTDVPTEVPSDVPPAGDGDLALQAGVVTPKPKIYSRAQWGADESIRDKSSLSYYEVHAGFVHHTVNANDYTSAEVPGIIRSIYNYHVKTRGWSDIGYNFLVDKYGRIWEGRAGGVDRPVVGAHTSGYNQYSFAMSAIGNFETAQPTSAMITAYAQVFAWKLSLHGVSASSTSQRVGSKSFRAINGHRDAGSTACPGRYLYAQIPSIRTKARALQKSWSGRELESNMAGASQPDLIVRRVSDGRGIVLPIRPSGGRYIFDKPISTGRNFAGLTKFWKAGDWDRDGKVDVIGVRRSDKRLLLYRGLGEGKLATGVVLSGPTTNWRLIAPVGDVTGDGWPDLMAQPASGSAMRIYPGNGLAGFKTSYAAYSTLADGEHLAVGRWNTDGAPDSIIRRGNTLTLYTGNGPGGWVAAKTLKGTATNYDWYLPVASVDPEGHTDVIARDRRNNNVYFIPVTTGGFGTPVIVARASGYDLAG